MTQVPPQLPESHLANPVVAVIGDIEVAVSVHRDALRPGQLSLAGGAAIAREPYSPLPATVVMVPAGFTFRIRLLWVSAM